MPMTIPAGPVALRPLRAADAPEIARHCADPRVARMTTRIPHPYPPGAAEAFVASAIEGDGWIFAMDGAAADLPDLCGVISLTPQGGARVRSWATGSRRRSGGGGSPPMPSPPSCGPIPVGRRSWRPRRSRTTRPPRPS